jgi:hypothetical protein
MSRQELSEWAASAFMLPRPLARTSLNDLLKRTDDDTELNPLRKASHSAHSPQLEAHLVVWINRCEEMKIPIVTGAAIRMKAEKIRGMLLKTATSTTAAALSKLMFSKGWLYRFQQRNGLKSRRTHGEAGSVKAGVVEDGRRVLQAVTSQYDKKDIYNMDETAYFYCTIPGKTISKNSISGRKKIKKRLTVAVTSNADGSTKLPLLFVGTARQPRCFGGKSADELGIQYVNAAKGWMNTELFTNWIERFNERMKSEGRHVLLLLDNVSSHRVTVPLSNVSVHMLPPNTTSFLQPQDAGIIQSFKSKLEQLRTRYIVDQFDELLDRVAEVGNEYVEMQVESMYHVDVLQAMQWAQEAWETVTSTTVANCWRHTKIIDDDVYELVESIEQLALGL